ncbi:MAG TPA: galactosamine-6-phosphate isomerase [Flavobacteriaceae bacterium]
MNITYCENYDHMSQMAYDSIISDLKLKSGQLICTATGNSPTGVYEKLSALYKSNPEYFKAISIVKLDEWHGINANDPSSCETYIRHKILEPLHIPDDRFIAFKSDTDSPERECDRIQKEIAEKGPIDLCILGIGVNGHIGFNEPAESISAFCHVGELAKTSMRHQMVNDVKIKPRFGLTLGMADILHSKKIMLLITGAHKENITEQLLTKKITTHLPASLLWLHSNMECYIDSGSLKK